MFGFVGIADHSNVGFKSKKGLLNSKSALKQAYNKGLKSRARAHVEQKPCYARLRLIDPSMPSSCFRKLVDPSLPRQEMFFGAWAYSQNLFCFQDYV
jgi:hypothetical protein